MSPLACESISTEWGVGELALSLGEAAILRQHGVRKAGGVSVSRLLDELDALKNCGMGGDAVEQQQLSRAQLERDLDWQRGRLSLG